MLAGIGVDGLVATAVHREVRLLIPFEVERADADRAFYGALPDRGTNGAAVPVDFAG
jgi:hypothetical protein